MKGRFKVLAWKELKKSMSRMDLCKKIIHDYLNHGTFIKLESLYNVNQMTLITFLRAHDNEVIADDPLLYEKFEKAKKDSTKSKEHKEKAKRGYLKSQSGTLKKFNEDVLDQLPKALKYDEFVNFLLQHRTGSRSVEYLIEIANKRGIKIIG